MGLGLIRDCLKTLDRHKTLLKFFNYPLLVIQGSKDILNKTEGIVKIIKEMQSPDKTIKIIENGYHELYADKEKDGVAKMMVDWVLDRVDDDHSSLGIGKLGAPRFLQDYIKEARGEKKITRFVNSYNIALLFIYLYTIRL